MNGFLKKHKLKLFLSTATAVLVLAVVFTCVFFYHQSFNDEISGAPYAHEEFLLPEAPPPSPALALQPAGRFIAEVPGKKTVYLTFDDGPSPVTEQILEILKVENVPATFFVLGKNVAAFPELTKKMADYGHKIANHSYSHDYEALYKSDDESFWQEVKKTEEIVLSLVDRSAYSRVFRFPGGSFEDYKWPKMDILIENDYSFIDWNCSNGDAEGHDIPPNKLVNKAIQTAGTKNTVVVLMHDAASKATTVAALPDIIKYFKENGYVFSVVYR